MFQERFLDINTIEHRFPSEVQQIGFPVTLLHRHQHAPQQSYLVYKNQFTISEYENSNETKNYYPCSWYMNENKEIIPYEFSDQQFEVDLKSMEERLQKLLNFPSYGTTVRPINEVMQVETQKGHRYLPLAPQSFDFSVSETATNGQKKMDSCYSSSWCSRTSTGAHYSQSNHKSW